MKLAALIIVAAFALVFAAMAAAWKRACLEMARTVYGVRFVGRLSASDRNRFVPQFVSTRHRLALLMIVAAAILGGVLYSWLVGLGVFVGVWLLGEALAFVFPRPSHSYYARQTIAEFQDREALYIRAGEEATAVDFRERWEQLEHHYRAPPTKD
jgi:hypothetical protein